MCCYTKGLSHGPGDVQEEEKGSAHNSHFLRSVRNLKWDRVDMAGRTETDNIL